MNIKQIMTKGADYCAPDTTLTELAKRMQHAHVGAIPIAADGKLVGMVTDRDIVLRGVSKGEGCHQLTAQDVMSEQMLYCFESDDPKNVLENMGKNQVRRLPVMDADKQLVGMVSLGDLAQHANPKDSGAALQSISQPMPADS